LRLYASALIAGSLVAGLCSAGSGIASAAAVPGVSATTSATALAISSPAVLYGDEQDEQFTATVTGDGGTPTGTVTVSAGATTVCTITLAGGTGSCAPTAEQIPVGTVTLSAAYSGDDTFDPSSSPSSPAVSLQITSPPPPAVAATTTTLGLSATSVSYGHEQAEKISVTVAVPGGGGPIPVGTVTVGSGTTKVCTFSLSSSGTGSCPLQAVALPPGTAKLTASYAGNADFGSSASAPESLTVAKEPTTTTMSLFATRVTYGAEQRERISVAVKPAFGGTPTGQVTVTAGKTTIRVIALTSGKGASTLAAASLAGGAVKLTASYGGDTRYARSSSGPKNIAIARTSSKTTLGLSVAKVTYGAERQERISVAVKPAYGVSAGHVTVKAGSAVICVITLRSAKGTCSPAPARLAAGRHQITAVYSGSGDVASSASPARTLSVAVASSTTTLSLSAGTVTYGSEGSEKISVKVTPRYAGTPGGTVTVKANGTTLAVIRLKSGRGSYTLSANRLAAGDYSLAATYSGNADFRSSASGKRSLTVASPPPPPAACYPLSSKGTCYEPGEYCSDADHGLTGIAGDGEAIICADNDGWRWEPLG
jgi:Bacterial Ig-like domain (group 3)